MKQTLIDLFENSVEKYSSNTFLLEKTNGHFQPTTYAQAHQRVVALAAGLKQSGVESGDRVSLLAEGSNDWIISELALLYVGAVSVPLSIKLEESNDLMFRLEHAQVSAVFVSQNQLEKIRQITGKRPNLKNIIIFGEDIELHSGEMSLSELAEKGNNYLEQEGRREELLSGARAIDNDHHATITYTSGTTADPKGVILTHRNYTANIEQALSRMTIPSSYRTLIILPLDHCFAHVVGFYLMIKCGGAVATVQVGKTPIETLKNIPLNIKEVAPDFVLSVPALAKNFRKNIENSIKTKNPFVQWLYRTGLRINYTYSQDGFSRGRGARALLRPLVALYDVLVFSKVRDAFGGRLKFFVGGGALLDTELQRFFYAVGMPMYQGYGLSEATPVISTNSTDHLKFGSSGYLVEPLELKIVDEQGLELPRGESGEIVVRGENVMAGYWRNETATQQTIRDGWLYTDDMGYMDSDGFLYVLGRFKSLLIASDGEKYSPEGIEEAIVGVSPYIEQIVVYNDQSAYTSAIIVPNIEVVLTQARRESGAKSIEHASVAIIEQEIARFKKGGDHSHMFPERWLPVSFALVAEPFSERNGTVNSTAKIVRNRVEELYADRIEYIYTTEGKSVYNPKNLSVFSLE